MHQSEGPIYRAARRGWKALPSGLQSHIRPYVRRRGKPAGHPAPSSETTTPLLSVIVPVHNVSGYLRECLESVLAQDYRNIEVIVVDDGSTDGSAEIAEEYEQRHARVRVLRLPHSGNGAARNRGIEVARGDLLAFADSDDVVEPGAYSLMVGQLISTGSDFVVGAFHRRKGKRKWLPEMMHELHRLERLSITAADFPEILRDVFLWNKVFRKDFWDRHVGSIPEGVLYEDQETTVRAFLRARAFDVLTQPVYVWRIREDNSSITQQKGDLTDLIDRMKAALTVADLVSLEAGEGVRNSWFVKALGEDLRLYTAKVPNTGPEYWSVLQQAVSTLYQAAGSDVLPLLPLADRVLAFLISRNSREDVEETLIGIRDHGRTFSARRVEGELIAYPAWIEGLRDGLPKEILRVEDVDANIHTRLLGVRWLDEDRVEIRAAAYLEAIDTSRFDYRTSLTLVNTTTQEEIAVVAATEADDRMDQVSGDRWNTYAHSVFTVVVPTGRLLNQDGRRTPNGQEWSLQVSVEAAGILKTDVIRIRDSEFLPFQLPVGGTTGPERVVLQIDRNQGLRLRILRYQAMAHRVRVRGGLLEVGFVGDPATLPSELVLRNAKGQLSGTAAEHASGRVFRIQMPAAPADNREETWDIMARMSDSRMHYVGWPEQGQWSSSLPAPDGALTVSSTGYGYLRATQRAWRVSVSDCQVDLDRETITITGRSAHLEPGSEQVLDIILATNRNVLKPLSVRHLPGTERFTAVFPLARDKWGYGRIYPDPGHYRLMVRSVDLNGNVRRRRVVATGKLLQRLPEEALGDLARVVLSAEDRERSFVVKILAPYQTGERGPLAQQRLREQHLTGTGPVDPRSILLESFAGKSLTDSVRALSDEIGRLHPDYRRYWTVSDYSVVVPEGCLAVLIYSAQWYGLLNSAGVLINNNNFPSYFRKRSSQLYIQTWHGTPLKKIGNHTPIENLTASYRRLMARESAYWDVLLAQNEFAAGILPQAFGYTGPVVCEGYPRNDLLHRGDPEARRNEIRARLGVAENATALLYTPTWRDNVRTAQDKFDFVSYMDFDMMAAELGDSCVVLFRGHHNVAGQRNTADRSTFIDVTDFPEIADLYLAADILVTDYSSSMFDFAGTGKPLIFLAPDIDEYRTVTRGFYFDFEAEAPGPILTTTEELIAAVRQVGEIRDEYRIAYGRFTEKYASRDDGYAAERVLKAMALDAGER